MEQFRRKSSVESPGRLGRAVNSAFRRLSPAGMLRSGTRIEEPILPAEDIKGPLGLNLLFDAPDPQVEFIFVHGLGGGSRKTWAISSDAQHYWPKEWLPNDSEFRNVRIHTFGYMADWGERGESLLNIRGFATSLIRDISSDPHIRRSKTKIVLIAHSMGGIVVKKAFMLAREDADLNEIAGRIHTLYFLATPHRGADLAKTLEFVLKLSHSSKPYVNELERNSESIASINDSFRHVSKNLHLWSFYETIRSNIGGLSVLVVDQASATLGYEKEKPVPMLADHRGISKYQSQEDSNYRTLRNHFVATIDAIATEVALASSTISKLQYGQLVDLTSVSEPPIDDLSALEEIRIPGSCQWLTEKKQYEFWKTCDAVTRPIFWLTGRAGFGKSVLSSYIITDCHQNGIKCNYFFFKKGVTTKSTIVDCLQSLAYQMASVDDKVLEAILKMRRMTATWERKDDKSVWRKLFLECIFKVPSMCHHVWVVDALDECGKYQVLASLFAHAPRELKIFLTSRDSQETEKCLEGLSDLASHYEIQPSDTASDFRLFVRSKIDQVPVADEQGQKNLENAILAKASGSFLWVSLVLQRLQQAYSEEEVEEVLNEVPTDMNEFYSRILLDLTKNNRASKLAKAAFMWTLLSSRPLRIDELQHAIKLDVKQTVPNLQRSVGTICGQLVSVNHKQEVEMIHETAKTYLLRQENHHDMIINKQKSHTQMAEVCLTALLAGVPNLSRTLRTKSNSSKPRQQAGLSIYASEHFSDHLQRASSEDEIIWGLLCQFLHLLVMPWIEYAARNGNISLIARTAKSLQLYFKRRIKHLSPLDPEIQFVATWIVDLAKLNGKFGANLIISPASIHTLVPALCPSESVISKFSCSVSGLVIKGEVNAAWDDCLARVDYSKVSTSSLAYGSRYSAVGLSDGSISLYCQDETHDPHTLIHGERTKLLLFSDEDQYLASSGLRTIKVWDVKEKVQLWVFDIQHQALDVHFLCDSISLIAATKGNYTVTWSLEDGTELGRWHWIESVPQVTGQTRPSQQPGKACFSPDDMSLAVSYRGLPIYLFAIEFEEFIGCCKREDGTNKNETVSHYAVDGLAFNPSPEINVLVASYGDGELTLYDIKSTKLRFRSPDSYAHCLAASPDGKTLVTGSSRGTIQVFEFGSSKGDKLSLIYRINAFEDGIRGISFSRDSLRFADIRGSQYRVWEPDLLVSNELEESSQSDLSQAVTLEPKSVSMLEGPTKPELTTICLNQSGEVVFAGRQDGAVLYLETNTASYVRILYRHASQISITSIVYAMGPELLVTADESGRILVNKISISGTNCQVESQVTEIRQEDSVISLVLNPCGTRLLVQGKNSAIVYSVAGQKVGSIVGLRDDFQIGRTFMNHPLQSDQLISIGHEDTLVYNWSDARYVMLIQKGDTPFPPFNPSWYFDQANGSTRTNSMIVKFSKNNAANPLQIWKASNLADQISISDTDLYAGKFIQIIAITGSTLLFLDDTLWVCSLDISLNSCFAIDAKRHFFLLSEWKGLDGTFLIEYEHKRKEFVVVRKHGILVVSRGLDFEEPWIPDIGI